MPILDWRQNQDLRSFNYLHEDASSAASKTWALGPVLDQGQDGSCTGHGFAAATAP